MGIPADNIIKRQDALPTWQLGGSTYHVEFTCRGTVLDDEEKELTRSVVNRGDGKFFDLIVGCIMPDHVHLILRPLEQQPNEYFDLGQIMKGIKGTSARGINRLRNRTGNSFWQEESYNRMIRNSAEFKETFSYIVNNPVVDGICEAPEDYPFLILARPELRW